MCGVTGLVGLRSADRIAEMTDRLIHRGPDGGATWTSDDSVLSLGHRRLSIIDPRVVSAQPMRSRCERYVIVFNGEIYNFRELRAKLSGHPFRTESDTEVLLETIAKLGVCETLSLLNGMFAFAVYDTHRKQLHLAIDRLGEKPLYYGEVQGTAEPVFAFASELKALTCIQGFSNPIDDEALTSYLRYNYVAAPRSIYQGIRKLEPGQHLIFHLGEGHAELAESHLYWDAQQVIEQSLANPLVGSEQQLLDGLEDQIRQSVASRMVADVPLGAFLSGGYDSTLVVAMMAASVNQPVRTFSIGQQDPLYNEADHARAVAEYLGTDHTEWILSPEDALEVIPKLGEMFCEPFADASQIPTYLVANMTRQHVTVALSGDGGDELFGGYNRHFRAGSLWSRIRRAPVWSRKMLAHAIQSVSATQWDQLYKRFSFLRGRRGEFALPGVKLHKLAGVLHSNSPIDLYQRLASVNQQPLSLLRGGQEPKDRLSESNDLIDSMQFEELMMFLDMVSYLPGDILAKVDRATMATSLESRVPLLDHRLVEHAWRMPLSMKIRNGDGKWALKQIVHRHVPKEMMERPKMGFSIPLSRWLRGPLRDWSANLLDRDRLSADRHFDVDAVHRLWNAHLSGKQENEHQLWAVLMFQSWKESHI
ncbi:asparagine synthase (glutamine-hydrolyzing) [Rhodopirellula europaea]|nr:asparagine synthase (glutamine-hydrolyzing) [Rhodopirellula europaea]